jgi:hypothetical protein
VALKSKLAVVFPFSWSANAGHGSVAIAEQLSQIGIDRIPLKSDQLSTIPISIHRASPAGLVQKSFQYVVLSYWFSKKTKQRYRGLLADLEL